jgi:hypothetical protein
MTNPNPFLNPDIFAALGVAATAVPVTTTVAVPAGLGDDEVLAASKSLAADVSIATMTRTFLPHQGAAYLYCKASIARWGGAILGHDMGLGKTQVLLALANETNGYAILIGPPVCKGGYMSDLQAAFPHLRFAHLQGRKGGRVPDADVYFISDDPLTMKAWLTAGTDASKNLVVNRFALGAGILIRDEIHRDKGANAKPTTRAKVMLAVTAALRAQGTPVVGATGTLLTNRPVEAFLPLQMVGGEALVRAITPGSSKLSGFLWRYCGATTNRFGTSFDGIDEDRMGELHEYLRRTVYCRIEKRDLGDSLPHGGWVIAPLALDATMVRYNRLEREFLTVMMEERGVEAAQRMGRAEVITRMNALREEAGVAKVPAIAEYVLDLVNDGRKVVVFYEHSKVFQGLVDAFVKGGADVAVINGKVTGDARQSEVAAFQAGSANVLLAQTQAAGIGVTLTSAADAVFAQLPWSAGSLKQAADRILRADDISRARALAGEGVQWHVPTAHKSDGRPTIDSILWSVLEHKSKVCDAVNAGKAITMPEGTVQELTLQAFLDANA